MTPTRKAALALAGLIAVAGAAIAHQGASGVVKERMEAMKDMAGRMKVIAGMIGGERGFDAQAVASAAEQVAFKARQLDKQFPEGSDHPPSEARPEIWSDWDRFSELASELESKASRLGVAAGTATAAADIDVPFRAVAATCKGCHQRFRLDD